MNEYLAAGLVCFRYDELITRFLEIAERKISTLDEYGDENWAALAGEIDTCIRKIAIQEGDLNPGAKKLSHPLRLPHVRAHLL